ncbi:GntR family transcriptional regulator [Streptomyces sp. N2-109]|uniref:GntR family transcriptional regulator n=1 Tax=Streptomyces gossypii TaxID=2883101 RepID=A0ABT2K1C9_9ACTN|nr:GntR family transcriptional regulator [Streptomyces gossypii]MCT2593968.1 GntR family transcriptional regulator [Streptomyces gossypii]
MGTTQLEKAPEPKYWHLRTVLTDALDSEFAVGEVLPNERELAARFGVARATLRQALEQLELEGRLQRRRGVGTTVAPPRVGVDVGPVRDSWPGPPGGDWQTEGCEDVTPPAAVVQLLATAPDAVVHAVRRTRMSQGQPVATELLYIPAASAPSVPEAPADTDSSSVRAEHLLRALHRLELEGQDRAVELGSAHTDDARQLDRLPGAPVLVVTTRYFVAGRTAAVSVSTYRADTCRLTFGDTEPVTLMAG